jgi:hypothetical protein
MLRSRIVSLDALLERTPKEVAGNLELVALGGSDVPKTIAACGVGVVYHDALLGFQTCVEEYALAIPGF